MRDGPAARSRQANFKAPCAVAAARAHFPLSRGKNPQAMYVLACLACLHGAKFWRWGAYMRLRCCSSCGCGCRSCATPRFCAVFRQLCMALGRSGCCRSARCWPCMPQQLTNDYLPIHCGVRVCVLSLYGGIIHDPTMAAFMASSLAAQCSKRCCMDGQAGRHCQSGAAATAAASWAATTCTLRVPRIYRQTAGACGPDS